MFRLAARARGLSSNTAKNIVVVDGVRIPFALSQTIYSDYMAVDLAKMPHPQRLLLVVSPP